MKKINLGQYNLVHFVGIGGIGMSGLAQIMKNMGFRVQGSDQNKNKNIVSCSRNGIKTFIGHSIKNLKKASILVKSSAIKKNNIEIKFAKKNKIPIFEENYHYHWVPWKNYHNFISSKNIIRSKIRSYNY